MLVSLMHQSLLQEHCTLTLAPHRRSVRVAMRGFEKFDTICLMLRRIAVVHNEPAAPLLYHRQLLVLSVNGAEGFASLRLSGRSVYASPGCRMYVVCVTRRT
jgi:hypothetical protein